MIVLYFFSASVSSFLQLDNCEKTKYQSSRKIKKNLPEQKSCLIGFSELEMNENNGGMFACLLV